MSTLPDVGALALVPSMKPPPAEQSSPLTFTTIPLEVRLKICRLVLAKITVKEVTWIEEPPDDGHQDEPAKAITHRNITPSHALALLRVNKQVHQEVLPLVALCPIYLQLYKPMGYWEEAEFPSAVCQQIVQVVTNMSLWCFTKNFAYGNWFVYPNVYLIELEQAASEAPIPAGLIMQHLMNGTREFKLQRDLFIPFIKRLDLDGILQDNIKSGFLTIKAKWTFDERRIDPDGGYIYSAVIAKAVG